MYYEIHSKILDKNLVKKFGKKIRSKFSKKMALKLACFNLVTHTKKIFCDKKN